MRSGCLPKSDLIVKIPHVHLRGEFEYGVHFFVTVWVGWYIKASVWARNIPPPSPARPCHHRDLVTWVLHLVIPAVTRQYRYNTN